MCGHGRAALFAYCAEGLHFSAFIQLQCASMQLVFAVIDYIIILDKARTVPFVIFLLLIYYIGTTMVWEHIPIGVYMIMAFVGIAILTVLCVCAAFCVFCCLATCYACVTGEFCRDATTNQIGVRGSYNTKSIV